MKSTVSDICIVLFICCTGSGIWGEVSFILPPPEKTPAGFVLIPAGTFIMGSPPSEAGRYTDEGPQHSVTISRPFYIGATEVTQNEWEQIMDANPSRFKGDDLPVENVSWYDVIDYCIKRSEREELIPAYTKRGNTITWNKNANGYRLPTEAEWEYAARAGTTGPFSTGDTITTDQANYNGYYPYTGEKGLYRTQTTPVKTFEANPWGLFDVHGNVWEWCWDWHGFYPRDTQLMLIDPLNNKSASYRIYRGGSWGSSGANIRSANRSNKGEYTPSTRNSYIGFRLVLPVPLKLVEQESEQEKPQITPVQEHKQQESQPQIVKAEPELRVPQEPEPNSGAAEPEETAPAIPSELHFLLIEAGTFVMGSPDYEEGRYKDEGPQHQVTISRPFYMSTTEINQREWMEIMETNPSQFKGDDLPVEQVSWFDALEYCNRRSALEDLNPVYTIDKDNNTVICDWTANGYRLPTEAEWEYAARGGALRKKNYAYSGSSDVNRVAWYAENSNAMTHPVGMKQANELGLYDMSGNVWEWCWDYYDWYPTEAQVDPVGPEKSLYRVLRGGGWSEPADGVRSATRGGNMPDVHGDGGTTGGGFRILRSAGDQVVKNRRQL
ncbi:MAG: SUMF1/EgtB/PvdO family nonheme iron enzyme [Spirochaetaceae bacterium]|jgi:formylglycine-generating enzyme required for sulfatase activity|nr:SUMF1/EgtB/PvdO family nonheme iron enzyme [Spirochaetaceae bacterium]